MGWHNPAEGTDVRWLEGGWQSGGGGRTPAEGTDVRWLEGGRGTMKCV